MIISDPILAAVMAVCWTAFWRADRFMPFTARVASLIALTWTGYAIVVLVCQMDLMLGVDAGTVAWAAYLAWTRRKPPRRSDSRVSALIHDLGHRLAVSPT